MATLHPDLSQHVVEVDFGPIVRHPLVVQPLADGSYIDLINSMYQEKSTKLANAERSEDWWSYVWLHERVFRVEVLKTIRDKIPPERYWSLVAQVWMDATFIYPDKSAWIAIWQSKHPYRERLMDQPEQRALTRLKETETIYRGFCIEENRHMRAVQGLSWTLDRPTALRFASQHKTPTRLSWLVTARVPKQHIQTLFLRRSEHEAIVLPRHLQNVKVQRIGQRG